MSNYDYFDGRRTKLTEKVIDGIVVESYELVECDHYCVAGCHDDAHEQHTKLFVRAGETTGTLNLDLYNKDEADIFFSYRGCDDATWPPERNRLEALRACVAGMISQIEILANNNAQTLSAKNYKGGE